MIFYRRDILIMKASAQNGGKVVNPLFFESFHLRKPMGKIKDEVKRLEAHLSYSIFWVDSIC